MLGAGFVQCRRNTSLTRNCRTSGSSEKALGEFMASSPSPATWQRFLLERTPGARILTLLELCEWIRSATYRETAALPGRWARAWNAGASAGASRTEHNRNRE